MALIDECMLDSDSDLIRREYARIFELLGNGAKLARVTQADDVLEITANLIDPTNETRLTLSADFADRIKNASRSKPEILGYRHLKTGEHVSVKVFANSAHKHGYAPIYRHVCKGDEHTVIGYSSNQITVKICRLSHFTGSRYHSLIKALCQMVDTGLLCHEERKPATPKRVYNNVRQMLLRRFVPKSYEWGLMFNAEISATLNNLLPKIATPTDGTFYLYDSKYSQCKVKIYNITAADKRNGQPVKFQQGDRLKFEITYKTEFFYRQELAINDLTTQNSIAGLLQNHNKRHLEKCLIDKLQPMHRRQLFKSASVDNKRGFLAMIDDERTTQVSTDERVSEIAERVKALEVLTEQLKNKQAAQDEKQAAQDLAIAELRQAVLVQSMPADSRKLRNGGNRKMIN